MAEPNVQPSAQATSTPTPGGVGLAVGGEEGTGRQDVRSSGSLGVGEEGTGRQVVEGEEGLVVTPAAPEEAGVAEESVVLPELSDQAIAFLTSSHYAASNESVTKLFNLSADDLTFLNEMDHLVLGGSLDLREYVIALRGEFSPLDSKRKDELIARLLAERFLPWGDALAPPAQEVVREEKLALPSAPYFAVYVKPLTYGGAAGEVARMAGIGLAGQVRERLRDLIVSKVKGIRIDAQIEEQLARPADFGGLGLSKEQARAAMDAMNDILHRARVVTEEDYSAWLAEDMRRKAEAQAPPVRPSPAVEDEDGAEIAAISSRMARPVRDTASVLALSVVTLVKRLPFKPDDEYSAKRLENIVSTRLRDVRSRSEVLMKLMRDGKVGGLGLERKEAEKIADQIEEGYMEFHELIAQEEKQKFEGQLQEQARKVEERKKREAEEHAKWFEEKVRARQLAETEQKTLVERLRVVAGGLTTSVQIHPLDAKERAKEQADFGELVPAPAMTPAAPLALASAVAAQKAESGIPAPAPWPKSPGSVVPAVPPFSVQPLLPRLRPSLEGATARGRAAPGTHVPQPTAPGYQPVVKVSADTAKAALTPSARPRVEDVKVIKRHLMGPTQELAELTLATFRRMGKTPAEAAERVSQKIELLGEESFERRVEGIKAWQACPLQKAYVSLVTQAFAAGGPVKMLADKRRAAGEDTLSAEELAAIVELNSRLRL